MHTTQPLAVRHWEVDVARNFVPMTKQSGTVLITVVMMVAIAAIIVTDMSYRQKLDIKRTSALLSRDQAFHYLLGAEEIANWTLVQDLKDDNDRNDPFIIDTLQENWAEKTQPFPVAGGLIQGRIVDLQSRFNVNSIVASDAKVATQQRGRLRRLMDSVGIPKDSESDVTTQMLVERMVDWLDANQDPEGFDGKEDLDYLALDTPYRAANSVMWDISELMLIEGFTADDIAELSDWVSFLPPDVALNVNTADPKILDAYDLGVPGAQIEEDRKKTQPGRHDGGYTDLQAFEDLVAQSATPVPPGTSKQDPSEPDPPGGPGTQNPKSKLIGNFSVYSEYYLLDAEAIINEKPVLMRSILYRPTLKAGAKSSDITIKTLTRKLEDPLKRV